LRKTEDCAIPDPTSCSALDADAVPLVLLATLAHPDAGVRLRLLTRLDVLIEKRLPHYPRANVRAFLARQRGSSREPFYLDDLPLELATRIVRIIYATQTPKHHKRWIRIVSPEGFEDKGGMLLRHPPLHCHSASVPPAGYRGGKARMGTHLLTGNALERIARFNDHKQKARAFCSIGAHLTLHVQGDLPWHDPALILARATLSGGRPFASLGFVGERSEGGVRFTASTAEAIIQFTACLARGERLVMPVWQGNRFNERTRIFVALRDFDGESAELPALVSHSAAESWLTWLPPLELEVPLEERLAIARWAYPPESWLTPELLEKLL
jgi:hypothetical protein